MRCEALQQWRSSSAFIYGITLLVTAVVAIITMLLTSDVSHLGTDLHRELASFPHLSLMTAGMSALIVCMLLLGYVFDVSHWDTYTRLRAVFLLWLGVLIFVDLVLLTPSMPVAPIFGGLVLTAVAWRLEKQVCAFTGSKGLLLQYLQAVSRSALLVAVLLVACWLVWLVSGREKFPDVGQGESVNPRDALARFAAPVLLAFDYVIISVCVSIRTQFERYKHEDDHGKLPLANYLHVYLILLIIMMFTGYMAVALSSYSHVAGTTVLFFSVVSAVLILTYMGFMIGCTRILEIAKMDNFANTVINFLHSAAVKAGIVLIFLPLSPLIFAIDACHQLARQRLWRNGIIKEDPGCEARLTKEMRTILDWDLTLILPMSMCLGVAIVVLRLFAAFIPPLMALLNLHLASSPWGLVLAVSFVVAIVLFLLPPVSGQMIYIPISMMLIGKWGIGSYSQLTVAVLVATIFCLVLKLVGSAMQQKCIGEPMSTNIAVKKAFQLHTAPYRVARFVLSQGGLSLRKTVVLVGMPDWPISVLCGVLGLPLGPVMLSTLPEVFKILPNCAAVGFILKAQEASGGLSSTFDTLAKVCFGLGVAIPGGLSVVVSFIVKRLVEEHKEEFNNDSSDWHRDPQEAEILAAIEKDNIEGAEVKRLTHWGVQPCWARAVLLAGSLLATLATAANLMRPFESFDFKDPDAIHKLPGGSVAGLIRAPGSAMLALAGATCLCLAAYQSRHFLVVRAHRAQKRSEEGPCLDAAI